MAVPINYWAVIVSTVAAFVLGWIWYGPLFGKTWAKLAGVDRHGKAKLGMAPTIIINLIVTFIMAYTLEHNLIFGSEYLNLWGFAAGLQGAFWNWLGFIVPVTLGVVLWENKSWKLWFITAGYYLLSLLIMGAILESWIS